MHDKLINRETKSLNEQHSHDRHIGLIGFAFSFVLANSVDFRFVLTANANGSIMGNNTFCSIGFLETMIP
jgi:hypothetical protein